MMVERLLLYFARRTPDNTWNFVIVQYISSTVQIDCESPVYLQITRLSQSYYLKYCIMHLY
jgi:hypothetical protein